MPSKGYQPRVSIVIPVYNAEKYLVKTLNSILEQSYKNLEVILVDDCSTDRSKAVIEPFLNDTIKYYCESKNNGGPAAPRNTGIRNSKGDLVMLFDSDDIMLPGKVEKSVSAFMASPNVGLVCTGFQSIGLNGELLNVDYLSEYQSFRIGFTPISNDEYKLSSSDVYKALCLSNFVGTSSVLIPRKVFEDVGLFDETLSNCDDADMWYRIALKYDFLFIDNILHQYRINPSGISSRGGKNALSRIAVHEKQLKIEQSKENLLAIKRSLARNYLSLARFYIETNCSLDARKLIIKAYCIKPTISAVKLFLKTFV